MSSDTPTGGDWMEHPNLAGMDKEKLSMLQNLAAQGQQKSQAELMGYLLNAARQGRQKGLSFRPEEIDTILQVLKIGKSPQEAARLDQIVNLMKMMNR